MRFLRRSPKAEQQPSSSSAADADAAQAGASGKGRPTPKRREAEARRRGPVAPPPRTQREAIRRLRGSQTKQTKEERRAARLERRERMLSGDERYLLPRDRGPVRAYVRDLVDSRRQLMGMFMPLVGVVLVATFVPDPSVQGVVSLFSVAMLAVILVEALILGRYVNRKVRERFPDARTGAGLGFYAFSRATMLRRLRSPRPRVGYGEMPDRPGKSG